MQITPALLPFSPDALLSLAPSADSIKDALEIGEKWLHLAVTVVEIESILHTAEDAFLSIADFASTSVLGSLNLIATVSALHQCMKDGIFSFAGASALVHGFSALASLDEVLTVAAGVGLGLAEFSGVASVAVTLVTFAKQVHKGDVPGAVLSGAKLVATVALTGHPVALGIVLGANATYALVSAYMKAAEGAAARAAAKESASGQTGKPSSEAEATRDAEATPDAEATHDAEAPHDPVPASNRTDSAPDTPPPMPRVDPSIPSAAS